MNEIHARKKLINLLNEEVKDIDTKCKKDVFENIKNLIEDFDADHSTDYYDNLREISNILDDDDVDYWLKTATKDGIDRVRCFVADTYSDDIYKLDGYNNLANVTDGDLESLVYDLTENIKDGIKELKQTEL